jgi:Tol biopolymer transport system component
MSTRWEWLSVVALAVGGVLSVACVDETAQRPQKTEAEVAQAKTAELRRLYYSRETVEKSSNVSAVERLTNNVLIERYLSISPDGKKLAFGAFDIEKNYGESGDIWMLALDTGAQVRLTSMDTDERNPTWGGQGAYVYFETTSFGSRNIGRVHASETGGVMQLTNGTGEQLPYYSDVTKKLVFASHSTTVPNGILCTVNEDGRQYTQSKEGSQPRWSPDGTRIIYVRSPSKSESQIWVMDANGANQTQLTGGSVDVLPSYSPDGKFVVFASQRGDNKDWNIWYMKADGSNLTQLTTNESADLSPCFDADGKTVYFCSNRGGQWDVWKLITTLR